MALYSDPGSTATDNAIIIIATTNYTILIISIVMFAIIIFIYANFIRKRNNNRSVTY